MMIMVIILMIIDNNYQSDDNNENGNNSNDRQNDYGSAENSFAQNVVHFSFQYSYSIIYCIRLKRNCAGLNWYKLQSVQRPLHVLQYWP